MTKLALPSSGLLSGLVIGALSVTGLAQSDNFDDNNGSPPPLTITRNGAGGVTLTWPDSAPCWILRSSASMAPGSWVAMLSGITHDSGSGTFSLEESFQDGGPQHLRRGWLPE